MAKNNKNKGFSLIEIVIAIAILSLLLIPIISQFTGTMRMNRRSKEMQKANENAQYILEYFKDASIDTLTTVGVGEDNQRTNYEQIDMVGDKACKIYVYDNTTDAVVDTGETVPYKVQKFDLETAEIGSKRTEYARTVYMDDLSACIRATEVKVNGESTYLRIAYELPDTISLPDVNVAGLSDHFERTNEGSYILYDKDHEFVRGIVCTTDKTEIVNPNTINAGNVHNLDSEGVALISGFATDFDDQALADIYASAMEDLRKVNQTAWEVEMVNPKYIENNYITELKKLVKISISEGTGSEDAKYKNYYEVNVDVVYECRFKHPAGSDTAYTDDQHTYNAFNQKFYYDPKDSSAKPPFIYFEYQPMVIASADGTNGHVEFAQNDYILVDSEIEDIKLYLFKPRWDYSHKYMNSKSDDYSDDEYFSVYAAKDERAVLADPTSSEEDIIKIKNQILARQQVYYQENYFDDYQKNAVAFNKYSKVSVHLNKTASSKPVNIYTNMDAKDIAVDDKNSANNQFVLGGVSDYSNSFKNKGTALSVESYPVDYFKSVTEEENKEDRYYTVSVHLTEVDNSINTIVLNGAKGEN